MKSTTLNGYANHSNSFLHFIFQNQAHRWLFMLFLKTFIKGFFNYLHRYNNILIFSIENKICVHYFKK